MSNELARRIDELVAKIKEKKELENLDDEYVREHILAVMTKSVQKKLLDVRDVEQFTRSKEYAALKSGVRKQLRETYGVFAHEHDTRAQLIERLVNDDQEMVLRQLLSTHQSSQERLPYYTKFYAELFALTGQESPILDIGCGLNPISYPFLGYEPRYVCCDVSTADIDFLNSFFSYMQINAQAYRADAINHEAILAIIEKEQPKIILMLKLADTLENLERHTSKKLIAKIAPRVEWVVVSFATQSLGGNKRIADERRTWFEKYLEKNEWKYTAFSLPNEKFYVIDARTTPN